MIGNRYSLRFFLPISALLALLAAVVAQAGQPAEMHPNLIEVFATTELPVDGKSTVNQQLGDGGTELHVYELDGIQCIESQLSKGLTSDPEQSKRVVLQRFQQLQEDDRAQMQHAATGLAKAMQYGVDRYPAIVFDGEVAVYGVTEVSEALHRYQQWQEDRRQ